MNPYKNATLSASMTSALRGLRHGLKERNFRIQALIGVAVLVAAVVLPVNRSEQTVLLILIAFVLGAELLNSAIEQLADVLIQEHHPGVAKVKELASAAVLVFSIAAAIIGACIFYPYL